MSTENREIILFFFGTICFILFLAVCIIAIVHLYQKKHLAYKRHFEELKNDHEQNLLRTELEIQEQTFDHIGKEIHDNIGLSLTLAKLNLNEFIQTFPIVPDRITAISSLLTKAISDLNGLSKSLNSDFLNRFGFLKALENEVQAISATKCFNVQIFVSGTPFFLERRKELIMFRIVQEALNNTIKHSNCSSISIQVEYCKGCMSIVIFDDGVGFEVNGLSSNSGSGLNNMHKRTFILNGTLTITSTKMVGTEIKINIPL